MSTNNPHAEQYGTRPFVAGSLTGIRAYRVREDGALTGIHFRQVLERGVNFAVCGARGEPAEDHVLVGLDCVCGFYGYFDGSSDYLRHGFDGGPRVEAIVEAYGSVVVGSRGFRAEKLRLVALVRADETAPRLRDRVAEFLAYRPLLTVMLMAACTGVGLAAAVLTWLQDPWWVLAELGGFGAVLAVYRLQQHGHRRLVERRIARVLGLASCPVGPADWRRITACYPGVPVYTSREAALAAHPLTVPEAS